MVLDTTTTLGALLQFYKYSIYQIKVLFYHHFLVICINCFLVIRNLQVVLVSVLMLILTTYVVMPRVTKLFAGWLYPSLK